MYKVEQEKTEDMLLPEEKVRLLFMVDIRGDCAIIDNTASHKCQAIGLRGLQCSTPGECFASTPELLAVVHPVLTQRATGREQASPLDAVGVPHGQKNHSTLF